MWLRATRCKTSGTFKVIVDKLLTLTTWILRSCTACAGLFRKIQQYLYLLFLKTDVFLLTGVDVIRLV